MFKQRLLTTLILGPLVLLTILYANQWFFRTLILLVMLACAVEWSALIPVKQLWLKAIFILGLLLITWLSHFNFIYWLVADLLCWALILVAVLSFPKSQSIWGRPFIVALAGVLLLPLFAGSMISVYHQHQGKTLVIYLLFLVWAADIGAYLAGKQWGQHKLIPLVSPGKTIEGTLGGFLLTMLVAVGGYLYFQPQLAVNWFIIAVITGLISIIGDLFISMLKRRCNLKDTGSLLPGHGGVLDRLDSLIAALPIFYGGLFFLAPGL